MKKILLIISVVFCYLSASAQSVTTIEFLPVCWTTPSEVDSNVVAYWYATNRNLEPGVKNYLTAEGTTVDVSSGGTFSNGYCCCNNSGGSTTVQVVDNNDGTYFAIVNTDTTTIYTLADSIFTTQPITVDDSTYATGTNIQDIAIALSNQIDTSIYTHDGAITDPIRTVDLNGARLHFEDNGNGYVSVTSNRDAGLFSVSKSGAADSLVFKFDFGIGADYGLMLDGPSGQRDIFAATGTTLSIGSSFTSLLIQATLPTDNTLTQVLAVDPITDQVKQIDISTFGSGNASPCQDTITQSSHGFSLGALVGEGGGSYFAAHTNNADSLPVAFVCSVIDANTFTIGTEGWIDWTHGQTADSDYFLQDNGSLGTSPDADFTVFAYRTFGTDKAAFDIPELVVDGSAGGGGSSLTVTASNGLNDQDVSTDVDVELGGTLDKNTTVETEGFNLLMGDNTGNDVSYIRTSAANAIDLFASDGTTNNESNLTVTETGTVISTDQGGATTFTQVEVAGQAMTSTVSTSGVTQTQLVQNTTTFKMLGVPAYDDDAAAGAGGLTTGDLYQTTGSGAAPLNVAGILMIKQ